jgi:hypothetical protein
MSRVIVTTLFALLASPGSVFAQAVQLPTFNFFGTSTTVSVPDHGTAFMGGNTTSYSGSNSRGVPLLGPAGGPLFNNRGIANGGTTSNISVTAQIHDMDAMDRALLGGMSADEFRRQVRNNPAGNYSHLTLGPGATPPRSITVDSAEVPRSMRYSEQELAVQLKRQQQAEEQLAMGQAMAARGKVSLAQSYYRMALNNANGELRSKVLQAQSELSNTAATTAPTAAERK